MQPAPGRVHLNPLCGKIPRRDPARCPALVPQANCARSTGVVVEWGGVCVCGGGGGCCATCARPRAFEPGMWKDSTAGPGPLPRPTQPPTPIPPHKHGRSAPMPTPRATMCTAKQGVGGGGAALNSKYTQATSAPENRARKHTNAVPRLIPHTHKSGITSRTVIDGKPVRGIGALHPARHVVRGELGVVVGRVPHRAVAHPCPPPGQATTATTTHAASAPDTQQS